MRALVVGDQVVGAMRRRAKKGEFRSNIHRGGEGTPGGAAPRRTCEAAVQAAQMLGLEIAGVDMLEAQRGAEADGAQLQPRLRGPGAGDEQDIAGAIIDHALAFAEAQRAGWSKPAHHLTRVVFSIE